LFTRGREAILDDFKKPEILRTKLEETVLKIKLLKKGDAAKFLNRLCDPPEPKALELALQRLMQINAVDPVERLTPLGFHLAHLPMDPYTGRMVLMAAIFSCVDPIFSCAASLSFKDCFYMPLGKG
jgi:ATP-dependent RNA helicase DHX36